MSEKKIPSSPSPGNEDHQHPSQSDTEKVEEPLKKPESSVTSKDDSLLAKIWRWLILVVVSVSALEIIFLVPYVTYQRATLATSRIDADIKIAELKQKASPVAYPPKGTVSPTSPSLVNAPGVASQARDAFETAVNAAIAQAHQPGATGHIAASAASILDRLVKVGTATEAEAMTLTDQLTKAGIDVTKDVVTEFGKAGAHLLLDGKKDAATNVAGAPISGNVLNYLTCAAPSGLSPQAPPGPPSAPKLPKASKKALTCPLVSPKTKPLVSPDTETEMRD